MEHPDGASGERPEIEPAIEDVTAATTQQVPEENEDILLKTGEVAKMFRVSPRAVLNWAKKDMIPGATRTPGGHRRYPKRVVDGLLEKAFGEEE